MKATTTIGLGLIAANLYANAQERATGTGTPDDPFVVRTHSPLLALIGAAIILLEAFD